MIVKRYISLFLLFLISFKTLIVPFIYLDFELRKEHIIQTLCENRYSPQLHCDGKCYLAKQLHKVAEEHARNDARNQSDSAKRVMQEVFEETCFDFSVPLLPRISIFSFDFFFGTKRLFIQAFHASDCLIFCT